MTTFSSICMSIFYIHGTSDEFHFENWPVLLSRIDCLWNFRCVSSSSHFKHKKATNFIQTSKQLTNEILNFILVANVIFPMKIYADLKIIWPKFVYEF